VSVVSFRPFMTLSIEESGSARPITAFRLEPTAATARRLDDHRLIFRRRPNGFQLYAQHAPEAGNVRLAPITARTPLTFGAWLTDPDFLDRYHPELDTSAGSNFYLSNLNADGSLRASGALSRGETVEKADAARIVARRLTARVDLAGDPRPTELRVVDRYDPARLVASAPVIADAASISANVAIDLSQDRAAAYSLVPQPAGQPARTLLVDEELAGRGAFAVVELVAAPLPGPFPAAGRTYVVSWRRRG
jgi:hypothetical protein